MYYHGICLGLKGVPISLPWDLCMYCRDTWTLWDRGCRYPIVEISGSKNHTFDNMGPVMLRISTMHQDWGAASGAGVATPPLNLCMSQGYHYWLVGVIMSSWGHVLVCMW